MLRNIKPRVTVCKPRVVAWGGSLRSVTDCGQKARFGCRPVVGQSASVMSASRNRANARFSSRRIDQELQGAQDALIAFEGYGPNGPLLHASVLQRPVARRAGTWFDRVITQLQQLFAGGRSKG